MTIMALLFLLTTAPKTIMTTALAETENTWFDGSWCTSASIWFLNSHRLMLGTVRWVPGEPKCRRGNGQMNAVRLFSYLTVVKPLTSLLTGDGRREVHLDLFLSFQWSKRTAWRFLWCRQFLMLMRQRRGNFIESLANLGLDNQLDRVVTHDQKYNKTTKNGRNRPKNRWWIERRRPGMSRCVLSGPPTPRFLNS